MKITGKTRIMFILADPVDHVLGSHLLNQRFEQDGHDVAVSPLHVGPKDLRCVLDGLRRMRNVIGFGVTIPHKIKVLPLLDHLSDRAAQIGSVNFVRREVDGALSGDNVDGVGFVDGLVHGGISLRGKRVLQLGAGGAGRAVAFAIAQAGASELVIANRTATKAEALARDVAMAHPPCGTRAGDADPDGFDVIVNTTSAGMHSGDPVPVDMNRLSGRSAVADIIMVPEMTPLLVEAQRRGCRIGLGKYMLIEQYRHVKELLRL